MNTSLAAPPEGVDAQKLEEYKKRLIERLPFDSTGHLFLEIPAPHHDDIAAKPIPRRSQRQSYIRRKGRK